MTLRNFIGIRTNYPDATLAVLLCGVLGEPRPFGNASAKEKSLGPRLLRQWMAMIRRLPRDHLRCRARVYLRHASQAIKERAPDSPVVPRALSLVNWDNERLWQRTAMDVPPDHPRPTGGRLVVTEVTGRSSDPPHTHHMRLHDA